MFLTIIHISCCYPVFLFFPSLYSLPLLCIDLNFTFPAAAFSLCSPLSVFHGIAPLCLPLLFLITSDVFPCNLLSLPPPNFVFTCSCFPVFLFLCSCFQIFLFSSFPVCLFLFSSALFLCSCFHIFLFSSVSVSLFLLSDLPVLQFSCFSVPVFQCLVFLFLFQMLLFSSFSVPVFQCLVSLFLFSDAPVFQFLCSCFKMFC